MPKAFLVRKGRQHITAPGSAGGEPTFTYPPTNLMEQGLTISGAPFSGVSPFLGESNNLHASYMNMVMQYRLAMRSYPDIYRDSPAPIDLSTSDLSTSDLPPTPCYTPESDYSSGKTIVTNHSM